MPQTDLPTVKVQDPHNENDFVVIDRHHYKPDLHKLWEEKPRAATPPAETGAPIDPIAEDTAPPAPPAPTKPQPPAPWVLRAYVRDEIATAIEAAPLGLTSPEKILAANDDDLMTKAKMGRRLVQNLKKAAADWVAADTAAK